MREGCLPVARPGGGGGGACLYTPGMAGTSGIEAPRLGIVGRPTVECYVMCGCC